MYLKLLTKVNLWYLDLLYVNILQLKIIRIYVQGKGLNYILIVALTSHVQVQ